MFCFDGVIDIIIWSILMKNHCSASKDLTKKNTNCINFKDIETKLILKNTKESTTLLNEKIYQKNNSTKILSFLKYWPKIYC